MIKKDYIDRIVNNTGIQRKDVTLVVNQIFELMAEDLINQEPITISNFGSFDANKTKPINVYSPIDGKLLRVEEQLRVHFKTSNYIKNGGNNRNKK